MAATAQIINFPRPFRLAAVAPLAAPGSTQGSARLGLGLVLAICERHGRTFDDFYREQPAAVEVGDASVDRDTFAVWLGIAGRAA